MQFFRKKGKKGQKKGKTFENLGKKCMKFKNLLKKSSFMHATITCMKQLEYALGMIIFYTMKQISSLKISFFQLSDNLTPTIKQEFKESTAVEKFRCTQTKRAAIVNCLGDHYFENIVKKFQNCHSVLCLILAVTVVLQKCTNHGENIQYRLFSCYDKVLLYEFDKRSKC